MELTDQQKSDTPKILFLDDNPERADAFLAVCPGAVWVDSSERCICALSEGSWDVVCLDHDLGGEVFADSSRADTGMEVVRHVVANGPAGLREAKFIIHSMNPDAGDAMETALTENGYRARRIPFPVLVKYLSG